MTASKPISKSCLLLVLSFFSGLNLGAQITQWQKAEQVKLNTITTAVPFLMIAPDARASGLGDAGLGLSTDTNTLFWNPSGLAFGEDRFQASFSYAPWMRDLVPNLNLMYLSMYGKLNQKQAIGGSVRYFSLGEIADTNGNYHGNDLALDFTFAQKIGDHWSGGLSARYIYSSLIEANTMHFTLMFALSEAKGKIKSADPKQLN